MIYCDTSFIAPLILPEKTSAKIERFMHAYKDGILLASFWTQTEFASIISRLVRMHEINHRQAEIMIDTFDALLKDSFEIVEITTADFNLATSFIKRFETNLRTGDALHLAIAYHRKAKHFYTLDKNLIRSAKMLKIPSSGIDI